MHLNKINLFLVISVCLIFFFLTYNDVKSYEIKIIDGDTLDFRIMNGQNITIRLSLVDTPERNELGYEEATNFALTVCPVGIDAIYVQDTWQKVDKYGRSLGLVYCNDMLLNELLLSSEHAEITKYYCDKSEFGTENWAIQYGC